MTETTVRPTTDDSNEALKRPEAEERVRAAADRGREIRWDGLRSFDRSPSEPVRGRETREEVADALGLSPAQGSNVLTR